MQIFNDNHTQQNSIKLFNNISYKLDLDHAELGAEIDGPGERLNSLDRCRLQLWACDAPYQGDQLRGIKIAEATFVPAYQGTAVLDNVPAMPPAGNRDFVMVMALVSEDPNGQQLIEDYVNFSQRQQFVQPRLGAIVATRLNADGLNVAVDGIENPREQGNLSGDLSLELWATTSPYEGGSIDGIWLGGLNLGQLVGGESRPQDDYQFLLDQEQIPTGSYPVLMLREWTTNGFVTRDFRQLDLSVAVQTLVVETTQKAAVAAPAAAVPPKEIASTKTKAAPKPVATKAAATNNAQAASKAKTRTDAVKVATEKRETGRSGAPITKSKPRNKVADVEAAGPVSVNQASADDLHQVKGISAGVAGKIVEQRPYENIDDLLRVPGIGTKLLDRIKSLLKL